MRVRTTHTFDSLHRAPELQTARLHVDSLAGRGLNLELDRVASLEADAFGNRGHAKLVRLSLDVVCGTKKTRIITTIKSNLRSFSKGGK
jgi:hypothetical protein